MATYESSQMKDCWNPEKYELFKTERAQPFRDLLELLRPRPEMHVVDLGCGTGELTRELHVHLAAARTIGIDNSPAMLQRSQSQVVAGLAFKLGDLAQLPAGEQWDLIFANASVQWVLGHDVLLMKLKSCLAPGGQLAIQVPANHDHPSHTLAHALAAESPFREALGGYIRAVPVLTPEAYAALLHDLGFARQQVRLQVYGHVLSGAEGVVEWVRGTLLTDYEKRLPTDMFAKFLDIYRARLVTVLDNRRPHFYPFKRILFWAELPGPEPR